MPLPAEGVFADHLKNYPATAISATHAPRVEWHLPGQALKCITYTYDGTGGYSVRAALLLHGVYNITTDEACALQLALASYVCCNAPRCTPGPAFAAAAPAAASSPFTGGAPHRRNHFDSAGTRGLAQVVASATMTQAASLALMFQSIQDINALLVRVVVSSVPSSRAGAELAKNLTRALDAGRPC